MKTLIRIFWVCGFLLSGSFYAESQYLQVSRPANIKESPDSHSPTLEKVKTGDCLVLLKAASDETNSYYQVKCKAGNREGWIYRTLVRRYEGPIPGDKTLSYNDLTIEVLDIGVGLCNVIKLPDGRFIIYDAGNNSKSGNGTLDEIKKVIPVGSPVELLILSHTDYDHVGAAGNILENYDVKKVVNTGYEKSIVFKGENRSPSYAHFLSALENGEYEPDHVVDLHELDSIIKPGITENFGDVKLTWLCGFGKLPDDWKSLSQSEKLNAVSIVVKIEYHGTSVILSGDAVGRHIGDPDTALIATEKYLVTYAPRLLDADILVAPHHGADNGSSLEFIKKVSPEVVIFSAGHRFDHPRKVTAERYLKIVKDANFYRTDRGDDEGDAEWDYERVDGTVDQQGDDGIEVVISSNGQYKVRYLYPEAGPEE